MRLPAFNFPPRYSIADQCVLIVRANPRDGQREPLIDTQPALPPTICQRYM